MYLQHFGIVTDPDTACNMIATRTLPAAKSINRPICITHPFSGHSGVPQVYNDNRNNDVLHHSTAAHTNGPVDTGRTDRRPSVDSKPQICKAIFVGDYGAG